MKITMHKNGWTPIITEFDLRTATQTDIDVIANLEGKATVVVIKGQNLTAQDELRIAGMFGDIEQFPNVGWLEGKLVDDGNDSIIRVSGKLDDQGRTGAWPNADDLDWHANNPGDPKRHSNIWLYGAEGTAGSCTSYANTHLAYSTATPEEKVYFESLEVFVRAWIASRLDSDELKVHKYSFVQTNHFGYKGLWFPWSQILDIFDKQQDISNRRAKVKLLAQLKKYITQDKFVYHHEWEDGDVVIADQWLGIHKREHFERMDIRILHRIATHFNNVTVFPSSESLKMTEIVK